MSTRRRDGGFTLIEIMIAIVLTGIVMGALYQTLGNNQRFYRSTSQILDVQQGIRDVAQLLPSELREVDAVAGDILAMGPDSITVKALRNTYFICAAPNPVAGTIITRNDMVFGYRAVDNTRDRALVFRDVDPNIMSDDTWQYFAISSTTAGAACTDGSGTGTTMTITGPISKLDSVTIGSPVRTYEQITYRLYVDSAGIGWLGVRNYVNGSWGSVSPVAGPLRSNNGISLTYYDSTGVVTATGTNVAQIGLVVRGISAAPIEIPGRRANLQKYQDSMTVRVALRNNS
jgi:prepilin-type N-terminal cleavage/methylation domain-containing protein